MFTSDLELLCSAPGAYTSPGVYERYIMGALLAILLFIAFIFKACGSHPLLYDPNENIIILRIVIIGLVLLALRIGLPWVLMDPDERTKEKQRLAEERELDEWLKRN